MEREGPYQSGTERQRLISPWGSRPHSRESAANAKEFPCEVGSLAVVAEYAVLFLKIGGILVWPEQPNDANGRRWNRNSPTESSLHGNRQIIKAAPKIWQEILFLHPLSTWLLPDHSVLRERGRGSDVSRETSEPPDDDDRSRWNHKSAAGSSLHGNRQIIKAAPKMSLGIPSLRPPSTWLPSDHSVLWRLLPNAPFVFS
jgi:hypothetical protein